jgi:hypothetical protein
LQGGEAHVGISDALADFPAEKRGVYANGLEHTAWQLLEHPPRVMGHTRVSRDPKHVSPDFQTAIGRRPRARMMTRLDESVQSVASDGAP